MVIANIFAPSLMLLVLAFWALILFVIIRIIIGIVRYAVRKELQSQQKANQQQKPLIP